MSGNPLAGVLAVVRIERGARYRTPLGRIVRWVPGLREGQAWLTFEYCDVQARAHEELTLTPAAAQRLLTPVQRVGVSA